MNFLLNLHQLWGKGLEITQERLDEMTRVTFSLTKFLGSNPALGMQR